MRTSLNGLAGSGALLGPGRSTHEAGVDVRLVGMTSQEPRNLWERTAALEVTALEYGDPAHYPPGTVLRSALIRTDVASEISQRVLVETNYTA